MRSFGRQFMYMVLVTIFFMFCFKGRVILAAEIPVDVKEELVEVLEKAEETSEVVRSSGESAEETQEPEASEGGTEKTPETEETPETEVLESVKNGWDRSDPKGKVYYYVNGKLQVGLQEIEGEKYYFSTESGEMQTGWVTIKGKKYYFSEKNAKMLTDKQKIGKATYYFKKSGVCQTGWVTIKGKKYYFSKKDAKMLTGKQKIGKATYYFKKSGVRQTGWVTIKGKKYYFSKKNAKMLTGKQKIGKNAYYFNKKGIMQTSKWIKKGNKMYYCSKKGILQKGWLKKGGRKYYFSKKNNEMQTGWVQIDGFKYYFTSSGKEKGAQRAGGIVGTAEEGFYYTDVAGRQVADPAVMQAVAFVRAHTNDAWSNDVKLRHCFDYLWRNYSYQRFYDRPSAASMPGYANYMLSTRQGNCFRYAASFAYIAKVLGYESRVAVGEISSRRSGMTPHGWTEINVAGRWYICDANMQKNFPNINSYMCTEANYAYRHNCSVRYTLIIQNGVAFWR